MISVWWLLLIIPSYAVVAIAGYLTAHLVNAIKRGVVFIDAITYAISEMESDERFIMEGIIDINEGEEK